MIPILLFATLIVPCVFAGTICPPRPSIYPCTCANYHIGKSRFFTVVTCTRLVDSDALEEIFSTLRTMEIDQFYLYDSFWEAHALGDDGESKKVLPADWLTMLKIKEIEIEDTTLASCFACQWTLNCGNSVTTRFTVTNSSSSEKICTLCDTTRGRKYPWTGCMSKLQDFSFNFGKLTSLTVEFFPVVMKELKSLNLSYNQIVTIHPTALKHLPNLVTLDLSHNAIVYIDHMFGVKGVKLEYLDVSWNFIKAIGKEFFPFLPQLRTFKAYSNAIVDMKETEWKMTALKIKHIDLRNNPINCDCSVKWVNSTYNKNLDLQGTCETPAVYANSPLRRASRYLNERCDASGRIGTRKPGLHKKRRKSRKKSSTTTPAP